MDEFSSGQARRIIICHVTSTNTKSNYSLSLNVWWERLYVPILSQLLISLMVLLRQFITDFIQ